MGRRDLADQATRVELGVRVHLVARVAHEVGPAPHRLGWGDDLERFGVDVDGADHGQVRHQVDAHDRHVLDPALALELHVHPPVRVDHVGVGHQVAALDELGRPGRRGRGDQRQGRADAVEQLGAGGLAAPCRAPRQDGGHQGRHGHDPVCAHGAQGSI
ncbi:MAG: hypothetical protein U0P45_00520 [Acidimicrobiales bacterium]